MKRQRIVRGLLIDLASTALLAAILAWRWNHEMVRLYDMRPIHPSVWVWSWCISALLLGAKAAANWFWE